MVHKFLISALLGAMIFFSAVITPVAFKTLSEDALSKFLRSIFPKLFSIGIVIGSVSTAFLLNESETCQAIVVLLITLGFFINRFWLTKKINGLRDQMAEGKEEAEKKFAVAHRISVIIYLCQMIGFLLILVWEAVFPY